ncbi:Mycobacterium rhizamassiliense ORFan [Mycobacterium rhizamassiliense]|jgi:hypothetical protein|uniref:Mycobacterium rhizamassiliense ORFan n=1 Tax=Mycobacterium rhizamassiliense TaxID=1841860 RepID=A0A2U3NWD9_9MYCO|nr:hypothetical protein [Mycobacterium rhizamassiliense]SPM35829.1 Mycobacterium rhizamassiliense ORFan [Mycobacterium rhizamassiliense]
MDQQYVFHRPPSEVWAVEYTNIHGDRVVDVLGTEYAARRTAEHYAVADAVVLRAATDFQAAPAERHSDTGKLSRIRRYRNRLRARRGNAIPAGLA